MTRYTIQGIDGTSIFNKFYDDKNNLLNDLKDYLVERDIVYIKGSRGMKMEEIITGIQN